MIFLISSLLLPQLRVAMQYQSNIRAAAINYERLRAKLIAEFPDLDNETLSDTLEGISDLNEIIAELLRSALADQAMAEGLKLRIEDMSARLRRLKDGASKKKQLALDAMNDAGIKKLTEPDFTASIRKGQAILQVARDEVIPDDFWLPQPPKLDRLALISALKQGTQIQGASLAEPEPSLAIRTK